MHQEIACSSIRFHRERELRLAASVMTIGAFDSVHRGHQELIRQTVNAARSDKLPAVVYTFDTPPKVFFREAEPLTSLADKLARIAAFRPDHIVVARFDQDYACRTAGEFIAELGELNPRLILVGDDFRFGSCKTGNVAVLRRHFHTCTLPPVRCRDGVVVSSTRIRRLRSAGRLAAAAALEGWKDMLGLPVDTLVPVPVRSTRR